MKEYVGMSKPKKHAEHLLSFLFKYYSCYNYNYIHTLCMMNKTLVYAFFINYNPFSFLSDD